MAAAICWSTEGMAGRFCFIDTSGCENVGSRTRAAGPAGGMAGARVGREPAGVGGGPLSGRRAAPKRWRSPTPEERWGALVADVAKKVSPQVRGAPQPARGAGATRAAGARAARVSAVGLRGSVNGCPGVNCPFPAPSTKEKTMGVGAADDTRRCAE